MVERIEGFATQDEWGRAYAEINEMEAQWAEYGTVIGKFWLQIDKDEQYKRFKEREQIRTRNGRSLTKTGATVRNGMPMKRL